METDEIMAQLLEVANHEQPEHGLKASLVPDFFISKRRGNQKVEHTIYQPCVVFVLQGEKQVNFAGSLLKYAAGEFLVMTAHMPSSFCVTTDNFVALTMLLDHNLLTQLCLEVNDQPKDSALPAMGTSLLDKDILDCLLRIMQSPHHKVKFKHVLPYYMRELYLYLLHSPAGALLWQIGHQDLANVHLLKVIAHIREHYSEILRMEDLARIAHMSQPTFFRRFRQLTLNSPLQYQKAIQLQQARYLLFTKYLSLSQVANEVGYTSQQQFTREYKRYFGVTPSHDMQLEHGEQTLGIRSPLVDLSNRPETDKDMDLVGKKQRLKVTLASSFLDLS